MNGESPCTDRRPDATELRAAMDAALYAIEELRQETSRFVASRGVDLPKPSAEDERWLKERARAWSDIAGVKDRERTADVATIVAHQYVERLRERACGA